MVPTQTTVDVIAGKISQGLEADPGGEHNLQMVSRAFAAPQLEIISSCMALDLACQLARC